MRAPIVLLFEDDPIIAMDIRFLLEQEGVHVIEVNEANELEQQCAQKRPEGVILNFNYSRKKNGLMLYRALKKRFSPRVLFITGANPRELESSPLFHPSFYVVYKPFSTGRLRHAVNEWLYSHA